MDPNLVKIMKSKMHKIKRGELGGAILTAQDYLNYILRYDYENIKKEMDQFVGFLKSKIVKGNTNASRNKSRNQNFSSRTSHRNYSNNT